MSEPQKYHVVEFHADGGQCCTGGRRSFTEKSRADSFADGERNRQGHTCGPNSVRQYESDTDPGDDGIIYTDDARNWPTSNGFPQGRSALVERRQSFSVRRERVSFGFPPAIAWALWFAAIILVSALLIHFSPR